MNNRRQRKWKEPWPVLIVTLILFFVFAYQRRQLYALEASPTSTQASVTELFVRHVKNNGEIAVVRYAYEVDARKYASEDDVPMPFWQTLHVGERVQVAYLAASPGTAMCRGYEPRDDYTNVMFVNGFIFLLAAGGIAAARFMKRGLDDPCRPT